MKPIFIAKVYEDLHFTGDDGRNVGWCETFDECFDMLQNFGDECRWSYAIIEESSPGMHGMTRSQSWFEYIGGDWVVIPESHWNEFMHCVNHTIG